MTVVLGQYHGGFVVLFAVLGIAVLGSFIESLLNPKQAASKRKMTVRYAGLTLACGLASLLNPQGVKLHLHIIELMQTAWYKTHIDEYRTLFTSEPMFFSSRAAVSRFDGRLSAVAQESHNGKHGDFVLRLLVAGVGAQTSRCSSSLSCRGSRSRSPMCWREIGRNQFASINGRGAGGYRRQTEPQIRRIWTVDSFVCGGGFSGDSRESRPSDFSSKIPGSVCRTGMRPSWPKRACSRRISGRIILFIRTIQNSASFWMAAAITMAKRSEKPI